MSFTDFLKTVTKWRGVIDRFFDFLEGLGDVWPSDDEGKGEGEGEGEGQFETPKLISPDANAQ